MRNFEKERAKKKCVSSFHRGGSSCLLCLFVYFVYFFSILPSFGLVVHRSTALITKPREKNTDLSLKLIHETKTKKKERNEILFKSFVLYIPNFIVPLSFGPFYWINQQKRINIQSNLIREFYRGAPPLPAIYKSSVSDTTKLVDYWIFEFSFFFY